MLAETLICPLLWGLLVTSTYALIQKDNLLAKKNAVNASLKDCQSSILAFSAFYHLSTGPRRTVLKVLMSSALGSGLISR